MEFDHQGEMSPEKDCWWRLTFQPPEWKSPSESLFFLLRFTPLNFNNNDYNIIINNYYDNNYDKLNYINHYYKESCGEGHDQKR